MLLQASSWTFIGSVRDADSHLRVLSRTSSPLLLLYGYYLFFDSYSDTTRSKIQCWRPAFRLSMIAGAADVNVLTSHHPHPTIWCQNCNGITIRPLDKDYYSNQQIPLGILLGFPSSSKGIKESNGQTALWLMINKWGRDYCPCLCVCLPLSLCFLGAD